MTNWFDLNPIAPTSILLVAIAILFVMFLFLELRRKQKQFLFLRITALVLMMLSLSAIVLRPSKKTVQSQSVALLTEHYDADKVDSLQQSKSIQLVSLPGVPTHKSSTSLQSVNDLEKLSGKVAYIAGDGLPEFAYDLLANNKFKFMPSDYPNGIIDLDVPEFTYANRENKIHGVFKSDSSTKIILEIAGRKEDSIVLARGIQNFNLTFTPKQSGNFLYTLVVEDNHGKRTTEMLPISVRTHQTFKILCIQNFPTFETQYLKKFLGINNQVQIRYQLSRNAYRHEAINAENKKISRLDPDNLQAFDLLIIDSDALETLGSSEILDLRSAVKNGLGLLILFNQPPENLRITRTFLPARFKKYPTDSARISLPTLVTLPAWPLLPEMNSSIHPILKNRNRTLAAYSNDGFGKIAFQLLQETYHLVLDGDSTSYSKIWSALIETTSRKAKSDFRISVKTKFPVYQDEPVDIEVISSSGNAPELLYDSTSVSIEENVFIDNIWTTKVWANEPGWHSIASISDSTREYFYVSGKDEWKTLSVANAIRETTVRSSGNQKIIGETEILEPIDPVWFYVLFLMSAGMLWLLPKL
jgi:hypothetical protein